MTCKTCSNYRFIVVDSKPVSCYKCNAKGQYALKSREHCAGCGEPYPCHSDCPCGTMKVLAKQNYVGQMRKMREAIR